MRLAGILLLSSLAAAPLAAQDDTRIVREWLVRAAHPVRTVEPEGDRTDLAPLHEIVRGARLIGMGESKHAMHELLQLRDRVLRRLVEHEGVSALAMESELPAGAAVNAWIMGDTDTPPDFAKTITYFGKLTEIQDAFRWLREHNLRLPRERRVRYYGVDLSQGAGTMHPAIDSVWSWLDRVDPAYAKESRAALTSVIARYGDDGWPTLATRYASLSASEKDSLKRGIDALVSKVAGAGARDAYVARSSREEYEWNARLTITLQQTENAARVGLRTPSNPRDIAMADNTRWVLERERGPVVLWAHDGHVQAVPMTGPGVPVAGGGTMSMGTLLRKSLGARYVTLGTTFATLAGDTTVTTEPTSLDGMLASVGRSPLLVDLRAPHDAAVERWLNATKRMHFEWKDLDLAPRMAFDALFFVDRISAAHVASGVK